jgi:mono/diheme cytochrome c family protein
MNKSRGWLLAGVVALLVACGDNRSVRPPDAPVDADEETAVERGAYIVNVLGACTFCHTPLLGSGERDPNKLLGGVSCFVDLDSDTFLDNNNGTGCLSTRNLTPHATGLGNKTDTEIKNAFRNGIRTDGKKIVPVMPWWLFHNMTDDDADAVVAYLKSITPVD